MRTRMMLVGSALTGLVFLGAATIAWWTGCSIATLDERDATVRIDRRRLGLKKTVTLPLATLREAILVHRGSTAAAHLLVEGGERIEVAAPTHGDAGQEQLVRDVNAFVHRQV